MNDDVKLITGELCYALLGTVTDNFYSVSFELEGENTILIRFLFHTITDEEIEQIDEAIGEFCGHHIENIEIEHDYYLVDSPAAKILPHEVIRTKFV